jgi:hypothetical protein
MHAISLGSDQKHAHFNGHTLAITVYTEAQCSVWVICGIEISLDSKKTITNFNINLLATIWLLDLNSNLKNNPEAADQANTQD